MLVKIFFYHKYMKQLQSKNSISFLHEKHSMIRNASIHYLINPVTVKLRHLKNFSLKTCGYYSGI